jgi:DNA-binding transcriptional LysR family regulator
LIAASAVRSPSRHSRPQFAPRGREKPERPLDLAGHDCINLRLPTHCEIFASTFSEHGKDLRVGTEGRLVFTTVHRVRNGCLAGFGLAYLPLDYIAPLIEAGNLVEVLAGWRKTFEGYHLHYPSRRQHPPALAALIAALRYRS